MAGYRDEGGIGSQFDDHYRSWRDRQIEQLDRDYAEYCAERQQRFESDFHSWRESRRGGGASGTRDAGAASTSAGGTGLGSSASFGSSNPDLEPSETGDGNGGGTAGRS